MRRNLMKFVAVAGLILAAAACDPNDPRQVQAFYDLNPAVPAEELTVGTMNEAQRAVVQALQDRQTAYYLGIIAAEQERSMDCDGARVPSIGARLGARHHRPRVRQQPWRSEPELIRCRLLADAVDARLALLRGRLLAVPEVPGPLQQQGGSPPVLPGGDFTLEPVNLNLTH